MIKSHQIYELHGLLWEKCPKIATKRCVKEALELTIAYKGVLTRVSDGILPGYIV